MKGISRPHLWLLILAVLLGGCEPEQRTSLLEPAPATRKLEAAAPTPVVPIDVDGSLRIWPFTGTDFSSIAHDPINLLFRGVADPRNVRNALLSLDGSRAGPFAPFDCTWKDAIGGQQTGYSEASGWSGSVIQLECGDYDPFRFHIRLFPAGDWTLANAHVEILIPGTADHLVLSWEMGEQFVTYDLARSGYLGGLGATVPVNPSPTFRDIPSFIYNTLPLNLRALALPPGGDPTIDAVAAVGIPTDGAATILTLAQAPNAGGTSQEVLLTFGQTIPKPFCGGPTAFARVDGPIRLRQTVEVSASGVLTSQTFADGQLSVRFVGAGGQLGPALPASTRDHYHTSMTDRHWSVASSRRQQIDVESGAPERLHRQLHVAANGPNRYRADESCGG